MSAMFHILHDATMAKYKGIPGPEPSMPFGTAEDFIHKWPWEACADYGRKYGGMSLAWFLGTPAIVLNCPDLIGRVLDTESESYYKHDPHDAVAPVITPDDLFISNGVTWAGLRAASPMNQAYTGPWLASQVPSLCNVAKDAVDRLVGQSTADLIEPLRRIVYDLISSAVWGELLGDENYAEFHKMAATGNHRMLEPPFLQKIPPLDPRFYLDRDAWYSGFQGRVRRARSTPDDGSQSLLRQALRANSSIPEAHLAQWLSAPIYFGGVFSAAGGIAHTLRFLGESPQILADVIAEVQAAGGAGLDADALGRCEKLDQALRESLRLSPPVTVFFRNVNRDQPVTLGGHSLPPDTLIFISNWLLHRDPKHWADPENYNPDRWANGGRERDPLGSSHFFPFGRGPRTCIGQDFAMALMKIVLAQLLTRARVQLDLSHPRESAFFFAVQHPRHLAARFEKL